MDKKAIIEKINSALAGGARFVSFLYTSKGTGETARFTIANGVKIANAYRRDLAILRQYQPADEDDATAVAELIESMEESLEKGVGNNSRYTCRGVYNSEKGTLEHKANKEIFIKGFLISKEVIKPGTYKAVKSAAKTIRKNSLRKRLKSGRFRQFVLKPENIGGVRFNGTMLEIHE